LPELGVPNYASRERAIAKCLEDRRLGNFTEYFDKLSMTVATVALCQCEQTLPELRAPNYVSRALEDRQLGKLLYGFALRGSPFEFPQGETLRESGWRSSGWRSDQSDRVLVSLRAKQLEDSHFINDPNTFQQLSKTVN
jgi:hypothetical protein